jgi:multidrug resistance efflux pump
MNPPVQNGKIERGPGMNQATDSEAISPHQEWARLAGEAERHCAEGRCMSAFERAVPGLVKENSGLRARVEQAEARRDHTEYWYAVRLEPLKDLCKAAGVWDKAAQIIANGSTTSPYTPPTYAQQLNRAEHAAAAAQSRAEAAEKMLGEVREGLLAARDELSRGTDIVEHQGRRDQAELMRRVADQCRAILGASDVDR